MKICIGLLTYCNTEKSPERFQVMQKCIDVLGEFKERYGDQVYLYAWDNGSSDDVKAYLSNKTFFDEIVFSDKNLFDVVAVHFLARKAREVGADYVMHLEDDLFFYDFDFLPDAVRFLETHKDCGYLRILKYEYDNQKKYTKNSNHPNPDRANWQRHYNNNNGDKLVWEETEFESSYDFLKTNWHWYNFVNLSHIDIFEKLLPHHDMRPLQGLEGHMMREYHKLGLKVGVLDGGAVTHLGLFNTKTSARLAQVAQNKGSHKLPYIRYTDVEDEVVRALSETKSSSENQDG